MTGSLRTLAIGARIDVVLDEGSHPGPYVFPPDQVERLVLPEVSREDMVVLVLQYSETQVGHVGNVDPVILSE